MKRRAPLIRRTASGLNSRVNFRFCVSHLRSHCHTKLGVYGTRCRPTGPFRASKGASRGLRSGEPLSPCPSPEVLHSNCLAAAPANLAQNSCFGSFRQQQDEAGRQAIADWDTESCTARRHVLKRAGNRRMVRAAINPGGHLKVPPLVLALISTDIGSGKPSHSARLT